MIDGLIEVGKIANTHGIKGDLRVESWADTPDVLAQIKRLYIDNTSFVILSAKVHKGNVIVNLEGVDGIDASIRLKGKTVYARRDDITLDEGMHFIADLIGLSAVDAETGDALGAVVDVLSLPAHNVYVIKGEREILIPAVPEYIAETNIEQGYIRFRLIEGL